MRYYVYIYDAITGILMVSLQLPWDVSPTDPVSIERFISHFYELNSIYYEVLNEEEHLNRA